MQVFAKVCANFMPCKYFHINVNIGDMFAFFVQTDNLTGKVNIYFFRESFYELKDTWQISTGCLLNGRRKNSIEKPGKAGKPCWCWAKLFAFARYSLMSNNVLFIDCCALLSTNSAETVFLRKTNIWDFCKSAFLCFTASNWIHKVLNFIS
jgi:hypothetical protein